MERENIDEFIHQHFGERKDVFPLIVYTNSLLHKHRKAYLLCAEQNSNIHVWDFSNDKHLLFTPENVKSIKIVQDPSLAYASFVVSAALSWVYVRNPTLNYSFPKNVPNFIFAWIVISILLLIMTSKALYAKKILIKTVHGVTFGYCFPSYYPIKKAVLPFEEAKMFVEFMEKIKYR
ncbi:MAG: hypothetical protein HFE62_01900 [Firmicutes bacterium]|nr:hypothetical protein [Bacillota bacterium]